MPENQESKLGIVDVDAFQEEIESYFKGNKEKIRKIMETLANNSQIYDMTKLGRYGENPHQVASGGKQRGYKGPTVMNPPLHGKPLGYNNLKDANAALETILEFQDKPAVVVVKHKNPCGLATGENLAEAFENAWYGDQISSFGSVVGYSKIVDEETVQLLKNKFVEVIIAPGYTNGALDWIKSQNSKKDLRVIDIMGEKGDIELPKIKDYNELNTVIGGMLKQTANQKLFLTNLEALLGRPVKYTELNSGNEYIVGTVTQEKFDENQLGLIEFASIAGKHTHSNAIVLAYEYAGDKYRVLGMGAGQPNRMDSAKKLALPKGRENLMRQYFRIKGLDFAQMMDTMINTWPIQNLETSAPIGEYIDKILGSARVVLYSDAMFPKRDGLDAAVDMGVKYVIQPGGSKADDEIIKAANESEIAMIFTGMRHFKH
ncbi:MAG: IMP cyclohydrolase [archaeon]